MSIPSSVMHKRRKFATDLKKLVDILYKYFPTADLNSFESAITELKNKYFVPRIPNKGSSAKSWGYSLGRLIFKFQSVPRHTLPENCKDLKLILDLKVFGDCERLDTMDDPFEWLEFNIVIEGTKFVEKDTIQLLTSYHLDRHIIKEGDGESEFPHPIYHFQFGGRKLKQNSDSIDTGELLIFDSPRIMHYPMEAILGIDFTLSNFFPDIWRKIKLESNEYINLLEEYQIKFLKPYVQTHASYWEYTRESIDKNKFWDPNVICPQLS